MITGNPTDRQPEGPLYERLVKPAILSLLDSSDCSYRCERDLHHHLTVCLDRVQPLNLGSRQTRMHAEEPAVACYGSGRHGNIDFFLAEDCYQNHSHSGIAVELNGITVTRLRSSAICASWWIQRMDIPKLRTLHLGRATTCSKQFKWD